MNELDVAYLGGTLDASKQTPGWGTLAEHPGCRAAVVIKGEHFFCDSPEGHGLPHGNKAAEVVWDGAAVSDA